MRTLLILLLSIGVFLTLIQYSNGAPRKPISSDSDEDDSIEKIVPKNSKPISDENDEGMKKLKPVEVQVNENDQSSEEKQKVIDALELKPQPKEPSSQSSERNDDDQPDIPYVDKNDYRRIFRDSDED